MLGVSFWCLVVQDPATESEQLDIIRYPYPGETVGIDDDQPTQPK